MSQIDELLDALAALRCSYIRQLPKHIRLDWARLEDRIRDYRQWHTLANMPIPPHRRCMCCGEPAKDQLMDGEGHYYPLCPICLTNTVGLCLGVEPEEASE